MNLHTKTLLTALTAVGIAATANAATVNWIGGTSGNLNNGVDWDTGSSPNNSAADTVNITNGGVRTNTNAFDLEGLDTYNLSNGGVLQNIKGGNKITKGNGATVNVDDGGTFGPGNRSNGTTINLSGTGVLLIGNDGESILPSISSSTTINLDPAWSGEVFFAAQTNLDEVSELEDWLDTGGGSGNFLLGGNVVTSGDVIISVVNAGSGNEPAFATDDAGLSMTLVPEPGSGVMALIGLGALAMRRRRG